jgi:hypothetical protein
MAARPGPVGAPVLDLLVDVQGAVPAAVHEYRDQETGHRAALPADPGRAQPRPGDPHGTGVADEHVYQAGHGHPDQDQVLDQRHADLGAGGDPDTDNRDHQHDDADGHADRNVGPGVGGTGAENGEHRRAEQQDLGHRADDVGGDHQPSGQEPQDGQSGQPAGRGPFGALQHSRIHGRAAATSRAGNVGVCHSCPMSRGAGGICRLRRRRTAAFWPGTGVVAVTGARHVGKRSCATCPGASRSAGSRRSRPEPG